MITAVEGLEEEANNRKGNKADSGAQDPHDRCQGRGGALPECSDHSGRNKQLDV